MNKLDELINNLCPNGVEYIELKKMAEIGTGNSDRKDAIENGNYPFYVRSKEVLRINKYEYDETAIVIPGEGGIGDIFHYVEGKYALHQRAYRIHVTNDKLNSRYLYYYMFSKFKEFINKKAVTATVTSIRKPMIETFCVAVPPLEVQCEIVHILDDFTLLSAELSAELKARQKQYEYYKNLLLNTKGEIKKLGEVASFKTGSKPKNIFKNKNSNYFEYINAGTTNSGYVDQTNSLKGAVTTPSRGQGGIGFVGYQAHDFWLGPLCYAIYSNDNSILNNKYLYYELSSKKDEILKRKNTGGVPSLNGCDLKTIPINIPPIDEQLRIINILDKFEKICEDISDGLPAEIEARRKQYEYYRDKLLTFKELKVNE